MAPQMSSPCSDPFYNNRAKSRLSCVPHSMRGSPVLPCAVVAGCWVQDWVFPIFNRRLRIKTLLLPSRLVPVPENEDEQIALRSWRARRHTNFVFAERPTPHWGARARRRQTSSDRCDFDVGLAAAAVLQQRLGKQAQQRAAHAHPVAAGPARLTRFRPFAVTSMPRLPVFLSSDLNMLWGIVRC
jgi:hypothetical protein